VSSQIPFLARLILLRPRRIQKNLEGVQKSGRIDACPNLWQLSLGVLRMWHRLLFRSDTIGLSNTHAIRKGWRAALFQYRPIRFPFLLWERSIAPLDLTGLVSRPDRIVCHLLGTHHEGDQFVYDLELLSAVPEEIVRLESMAEQIVNTDNRRTRWLRDLVVFEGYHEELLREVKRWRGGANPLTKEQKNDADITLQGFLSWCVRQPKTPGETWRLWRLGSYSVGRGLVALKEKGIT